MLYAEKENKNENKDQCAMQLCMTNENGICKGVRNSDACMLNAFNYTGQLMPVMNKMNKNK